MLRFTTKDVTIELQGSEEFVERQIRFFKHYLEEPEAQEEPPPQDEGTRPSLETFYQSRASKAGRGAIQESLLLFGYYLQEVEGQPEFSIEQIGGCFGVVGRPLPKNLHHAVGTLKRKHKWFQEGSKRGSYRLSEQGRKLVKPLM
ncbi:MAG: hypothetical protein ACYTEZ_16000 [Planctomycetota bacterium]